MVRRLAPPLKDLQFSCGGALKHTKMVDPWGGGYHIYIYVYIFYGYIHIYIYICMFAYIYMLLYISMHVPKPYSYDRRTYIAAWVSVR